MDFGCKLKVRVREAVSELLKNDIQRGLFAAVSILHLPRITVFSLDFAINAKKIL